MKKNSFVLSMCHAPFNVETMALKKVLVLIGFIFLAFNTVFCQSSEVSTLRIGLTGSPLSYFLDGLNISDKQLAELKPSKRNVKRIKINKHEGFVTIYSKLLIVLDDKLLYESKDKIEKLSKITQDEITSFNMLNAEEAKMKYGKKGKYGALILITRTGSREFPTKELKWDFRDSTRVFKDTNQIIEWGKSFGPFVFVTSEKLVIKNSAVFILKVDICSGISCPSILVFKEKNKLWQLVAESNARLIEQLEIKVDDQQEKIRFITKSGQIGELPFEILN